MRTHSVTKPPLSSGPGQDAFVVLLGELTTSRPEVYEHCHRVAELAGGVAAAFPALDTPAWEVERAALAHDIGKRAIPLSVLRKPAGLTPGHIEIRDPSPSPRASRMGRILPDFGPARPAPSGGYGPTA